MRTTLQALIVLLFVSAVVLPFDVLVGRPVFRQFQTIRYQATVGEVVRCQIRKKPDPEVEIEYTYHVDDQKHSSQRVRYLQVWGPRQIGDYVAEHPTGSAVTVYYDPHDPARSVLIPGVGDLELFLPLFLLPFNVIMLTGWGGFFVYCCAGEKGLRRVFHGFRLIDRPDEVRVTLPPHGSPILAAVMMLTFGSIPAILVVVVVFLCCGGTTLAFAGTITGWAVVLALTGLVWLRSVWHIASGKVDLVIDRRHKTITLPQTFGRKKPVTIALTDVQAVDIVRATDKDNATTFTVVLRWRDASGESVEGKLVEGSEEKEAERIVALIKQKPMIRSAQ